MILTLEVSGPEAAKLGVTSRKVFNARGGTIGRLADNDWVLPDRYVSSRHARIQYENDNYYLIDESTNGVCINSPDNHLNTGRPYALQSGDWILIDPYEIHVSIAEEETSSGVIPLSRPLDTPPQRAVPSPIDPFARDDAQGGSSRSRSGPRSHRTPETPAFHSSRFPPKKSTRSASSVSNQSARRLTRRRPQIWPAARSSTSITVRR